MTATVPATRSRGGPLLMLALLLTAWTGVRAVWWENPFAAIGDALGQSFAAAPVMPSASDAMPETLAIVPPGAAAPLALPAVTMGLRGASLTGTALAAQGGPQLAAAHHLLWYAAMRDPAPRAGYADWASSGQAAPSPRDPAPVLAGLPPASPRAADRWTLDSWAFWRQGSNAAPVSQGRVPIYGASQAGAVLQYRLAPEAARDPRLYARAYRALVRRGESELALGASARPLPQVPVRLAGEVRFTDGAFTNTVRPSAYAVTELAPLPLPLGTQLEAYGQAGWVGGPGATGFADGQASLTGEVRQFAALTDNAARLSVGAAAWGGAQRDAQRIDVGPTMRIDLTVGEVPARFSLDWRERVGGDAGPGSGLAATISTRF
ncbi:MAG TPA: hypothetical protein VK913_06360 [Erythrobacter sp.]|nr:hypothetical protein [Erythrobacter sp.]